jgi:hypothetical protein
VVASRSGVSRFSSANSLKPEITAPSQTPFPTQHDSAYGSEARILIESTQLAQASMTCSSAGLTFIRSLAQIDNTRVKRCEAQNVAACCTHPISDMLSLNIVVLVSDVTSFNSPPCAKAISRQRLKPSRHLPTAGHVIHSLERSVQIFGFAFRPESLRLNWRSRKLHCFLHAVASQGSNPR